MSNRKVTRAKARARLQERNVAEIPIGTPVQQMWQVLRVHEERIKQLSNVVEKVLFRLDQSNVVENSIKVNTEIETMKTTVSKLQKQINSIKKENH